jgi:hypothetical protein
MAFCPWRTAEEELKGRKGSFQSCGKSRFGSAGNQGVGRGPVNWSAPNTDYSVDDNSGTLSKNMCALGDVTYGSCINRYPRRCRAHSVQVEEEL